MSGFQSAGSGTVFGATGNGTGCELTTAWSVNASPTSTTGRRNSMSPSVGSYLAVNYDAPGQQQLCAWPRRARLSASSRRAPAPGGRSRCCRLQQQLDFWSAATRLQYDFTKTLYIGVEFLYQHLDTATAGTCAASNALCPQAQMTAIGPAGNGLTPGFSIKDENVLSVTARIHKDFLP